MSFLCAPFVLFALVLAGLDARVRGRSGEQDRSGRDGRDAFVEASVVFGTVILVVAEVLSAFRAFREPAIRMTWVILTVAATVGLRAWWTRSPVPADQAGPAPSTPSEPGGWLSGLLLAALGVLVSGVLATAWFAPEHSFDGLWYHLPRVLHWLELGSVAPYRTSGPLDVLGFPFAEMAVAQFLALRGGVLGTGVPQAAAYAGSGVVASLLARELGLPASGQLVAAALCLATHQGTLYASNIKQEWIVAFWVGVAAVACLRLGRRRADPAAILLGSLALGLAVATKPSGGVYGIPMALYLASHAVIAHGIQRRIRIAALLSGLLLPLPHVLRCLEAIRPGVPRDTSTQVWNGTWSPPAILAVGLRNLGVHASGLPEPWIRGVEAAVREAEKVLGRPDPDLETSFMALRFTIEPGAYHEFASGWPLQACLGLLAVSVALSGRGTLVLLGALAAGAGLVGVVALKWQPWITRFQLALLVPGAPLMAHLVARIAGRRLPLVASLALVVHTWPSAWCQATRPVIAWQGSDPFAGGLLHRSPLAAAYVLMPDLRTAHRELVSLIRRRGARAVALIAGPLALEGGLMLSLRELGAGDVRLQTLVGIQGPETLAPEGEVDLVVRIGTPERPLDPVGAPEVPGLVLEKIAERICDRRCGTENGWQAFVPVRGSR